MESLLKSPVFLVFTWLTITSIVTTIAHAWQKVRRAEMDAALKQDMIQRNLSADDIVRIIQASNTRPVKVVEEKPAQEAA